MYCTCTYFIIHVPSASHCPFLYFSYHSPTYIQIILITPVKNSVCMLSNWVDLLIIMLIFFLVFLFSSLLEVTVSIRIQLSWVALFRVIKFSCFLRFRTGQIEGKHLNATYSPLGNQSAIVFFGVPYVQPPIGELRFRKARPPVPWDGILETKEYKPACMSNMTWVFF